MKQCSHPDCVFNVFSKTLCQIHWKQQYGKPIAVKAPSKPIYRTKEIKKVKTLTVTEIQRKNARNVFFAEQALVMPHNCENCGEPLQAFNAWSKRCCTAHILAKSKFPSVETHPMNRLFLGASVLGGCSCHDSFDLSDAKYRIGMKCYPLAIERLQAFKHLLTPREQVIAEKYLNIEL